MNNTAKHNATDMTVGSPIRLLLAFALPLILGNFLQQFYAVVDTIVVGRGVGIEALAAIGASDWINWLMLWMIQGFTQGFSIPIAQHYGAADDDALRKTVAMSAVICLLLSAVLTSAGLLIASPMLRLLRTPENIIGGSWTYLQIVFSGIPVIMAYNMASSVLRALGDGKTPLKAMGIAACINVGLDMLFVFVFHWGIRGAATATVIAQIFSFLYCLRAIGRVPALQMRREDWRLHGGTVKRLLRIGIPLGLGQGVIAVGGMVLQTVVNGFGFLFVAAFTAGNKLLGVLECTAISLGFSMSTYMGQNYGARRLDRIRLGMRQMLKIAVAVSLVISACMLVGGRQLVGLFVSGPADQVEQVVGIACRYLRVMSLFLIALYLLHIYRSALQGFGNAAAPTVSNFIELGMRMGGSLLLPLLLGESGIFFAEVAAWSGAALQLVLCYYWELHKIEARFENERAVPMGGTAPDCV